MPVALVSIVEQSRQIFPGALGLPAPWQQLRETPLTHSFCQYVVADRQPLVISDARRDPRVANNLAITDLNVVAYAGYPIVDGDAGVIGALCAIDDQPREWTAEQLSILADLAETCSTELSLRRMRRRAELAEESATASGRHARALLLFSEGLGATLDVSEVAFALEQATAQASGVAHAGLWLWKEASRELVYVRHPKLSWPQAERRSVIGEDDASPIVSAARSGRVLLFGTEEDRIGSYPVSKAREGEAPLGAVAYIPLRVAGQLTGTLALAWNDPRPFTVADGALFNALASYAGQAVQRAQLITHRTHSATELQRAMLSALPEPDHLELRARYVPATAQDLVGGDWYDSFLLPDGATLIAIGDVVGHDIAAAAKMGQVRNILRGLAWTHPETPARLVRDLDRALDGLQTGITATLILGRIEQPLEDADQGLRTFRWSNAGHLPPLLLEPDGTPRLLDGEKTNTMIGVHQQRPRQDHTASLQPGATLLLYTDGLIERRDESIDDGLQRLLETVATHRNLKLDDLLDVLIEELVAGAPTDDIALVAIRFHPEDQPRPAEAGPRKD